VTVFGHFSSDLLLLNDNFPLYHQASGGFINIHESSILPLSPLSFPSIPNSPPITSSLPILGFTLPLNPTHIESLWSSLKQRLTTRADIISSHNLSLKGCILIIKSLLVSKLWYYVVLWTLFPQQCVHKAAFLTNQIHEKKGNKSMLFYF